MNNRAIGEFYFKKKILVVGGAGFIGSNLSLTLVKYGARVTICDPYDRMCGANPRNISGIKGGAVIARRSIERFIRDSRFGTYDIIFCCSGSGNHHVGIDSVCDDYRINCESVLAVLKQVIYRKSRCRIVSIGSRSQYGRPGERAVDESHPMDPIDIQAIHKVALEHYMRFFAKDYGLDLTYLRMTNVYGPRQRLSGKGIGFMGELIRGAVSDGEVLVYGSPLRIKDVLFVDDVVDALLLAGMGGRKGFSLYNVGGAPHPIKDIVEAIRGVLSIKVKIKPFPEKIRKIDSGDVVLDSRLIKKDCGWAPAVSIKKGVRATIDYVQSNKRYYLDNTNEEQRY